MKIALLVLTFDEIHIADYLRRVIDGIKQQEIDADVDVLFVDNMSSDGFREEIKKECDENNYECISIPNTRYPICTCKNIGWQWFQKHNTKYDYYVFCADDICMSHSNDLQILIQSFVSGCGAVSGYLSKDMCLTQWRRITKNAYNKKEDLDLISQNIHVYNQLMIYSDGFFKKFNYKEIDILWNWGYESLLIYLCKSVGMTWKVCMQTGINNVRFSTSKKGLKRPSNNGLFNFHITPDPKQRYNYVLFTNDPETNCDIEHNKMGFDNIFLNGAKIGLGWHRSDDRLNPVSYIPDMSNYDSSGNHKNKEKLHKYIMEHLFLSNEVLDYEKILDSICVVRSK